MYSLFQFCSCFSLMHKVLVLTSILFSLDHILVLIGSRGLDCNTDIRLAPCKPCTVQRLCRRKVDRSSRKWEGRGRRDGVTRVSTALGVLEMTELTPEPCHILFSASLASVRGRGREKKESLSNAVTWLLARWRQSPLMRKGQNPTHFQGWGQMRSIKGLPLADEWVSHAASGEAKYGRPEEKVGANYN